MMNNVFFIADTHFGHSNILDHCPNRKNGHEEFDIEKHDRLLIDKWNTTIKRKDTVYILGDFSFYNREKTEKILNKLNGIKHLIVGNHDASAIKLKNYFVTISEIKMVKFKQNLYPFLEEDINIILCHYPLLTWQNKHKGSIHLHGHCHGRIDSFNENSSDLRLDVGLDSDNCLFKPIDLSTIYNLCKKKTQNMLLADYTKIMKNNYNIIL